MSKIIPNPGELDVHSTARSSTGDPTADWRDTMCMTTSVALPSALRRAAALLALVAAACSPDTAAPASGTTIDREAFIATYVDLRTTVVRAEAHELSDEDRSAVLSRHGVTEEDLLSFVETHGGNVAFMRQVWDEVEARLDAVRVLPGTDEGR